MPDRALLPLAAHIDSVGQYLSENHSCPTGHYYPQCQAFFCPYHYVRLKTTHARQGITTESPSKNRVKASSSENHSCPTGHYYVVPPVFLRLNHLRLKTTHARQGITTILVIVSTSGCSLHCLKTTHARQGITTGPARAPRWRCIGLKTTHARQGITTLGVADEGRKALRSENHSCPTGHYYYKGVIGHLSHNKSV